MMLPKIFFCGCSFTRGEGFDQDQRHLCFPALVSETLGYHCENWSRAGWSNYRIFMQAASALLSDHANCDIYVIQWTGLNRLFLYPGPDTSFASNDQFYPDFRYYHKGIFLNKSQKKDFCELLTMFNGDYQNILDLVDHCQILAQLAASKNKKICFVNGLLPWTQELVTMDAVNDDLAQTLSEHSRVMLELHTRDDKEVRGFLITLQQRLRSLDWSLWVNAWQSMYITSQDLGPLGHHPGIRSHAAMAELICKHLIGKTNADA